MPTEVIELGAVELIEMGATRSIEDPLASVKSLVNYIEDPFAGIEVLPGESISPKQRAIGKKLKTLSKLQKRALVSPGNMTSLGSLDSLLAESFALSRELDRFANDLDYVADYYYSIGDVEMGKFFKKIVSKARGVAKKVGTTAKKVSKKVAKVVKSPAFLAAAGLVANVIPGVGSIVSAGLLAASAAMEMRKRKKAAEKGEVYEPNPIETLVTAVARPVAAGIAFPKLAEGANELFGSVTADFAKKYPEEAKQFDIGKLIMGQAQKLVPGFKAQGEQSVISTILSAAGQTGAVNNLIKGTGTSIGNVMGGGSAVDNLMNTVSSAAGLKPAVQAGEQDLINMGSAVGQSSLVEKAIDEGKGFEFPVTEALIGTGVLILLITVISTVARSGR